MTTFLYNLIFTLILVVLPIAQIVFFAVSLYRFKSAKKENKKIPHTFSEEEIAKRKSVLTIASVLFGIAIVYILVALGCIALLFLAIAYM